jgi:hypothetical protein
MKITAISEVPKPNLLNPSDFFCECQMVRKGTPHACVKAETKPSTLERLFPDRWFSTQVIVASIVAILIIVFAFNQWV